MRKANIVIMGKTGAGKSTIVNAIMEKKVAEVGRGQPITKENEVYTVKRRDFTLYLYDTVGLEINDKLNRRTLSDIKERISDSARDLGEDGINAVWFCINANSARFEEAEKTLIDQLIYDHEIPFVIVLTQAHTKSVADKFKLSITSDYPVCAIRTVLAEEFYADDTCIEPFGMNELLDLTVNKYGQLKGKALQRKVDVLQEKIDSERVANESDIAEKKNKAVRKIEKAAQAAFTLGCIPFASIASIQGPLTAGYNDINSTFGIKMSSDAMTDLAASAIGSIICAPILAVPFLGGSLAKSMVEDMCNKYLDAVIEVYSRSTVAELQDKQLTAERLKEQLEKLNQKPAKKSQ